MSLASDIGEMNVAVVDAVFSVPGRDFIDAAGWCYMCHSNTLVGLCCCDADATPDDYGRAAVAWLAENPVEATP